MRAVPFAILGTGIARNGGQAGSNPATEIDVSGTDPRVDDVRRNAGTCTVVAVGGRQRQRALINSIEPPRCIGLHGVQAHHLVGFDSSNTWLCADLLDLGHCGTDRGAGKHPLIHLDNLDAERAESSRLEVGIRARVELHDVSIRCLGGFDSRRRRD